VTRADWPALGTTATVIVTDRTSLDAARAAVERELAAIDAACSRFREDSELSRLNAANGRATAVGPLLLEAVAVALRAAALTDGAVDPTIGMALLRAGYDRDFAQIGSSDDASRTPVRVARATWRDVRVDAVRGLVTLPAGVRLDLGATAKALAADRAAATAAAAAGSGAGVLVSLGGDIAVAGAPPAGGWLVKVAEDHRADAGAPGPTITIRSGGLATSSVTVRRWGAGAHHLIDPATGRPAVAPWRTASVAAASCVDANVASTAAIIEGHAAPSWLTQRGLPARLVADDGTVLTLSGWPEEAAASCSR
jgi:thiamine biosynthesis lipoprotein ApbE